MEPFALSIADTAKSLSLGRTTVYSLIKHGELDARKIRGRTVVTTESIRSLLQRSA